MVAGLNTPTISRLWTIPCDNLKHITSVAQSVSTTVPSLIMRDELGIVYLIDTAQQFWSELEDVLKLPEDKAPTLSLLDATLKRFLVLCATYHEQYLQSPLQLEHACNVLLDSELFAFHSERMCEIIVDDAQTTTDPHSVYIFYEVLFFYGHRRSDVFRSHRRWQSLLPLLMDHVMVEIDPDIEDRYAGTSTGRSTNLTAVPIPIEAKLRSLSVRLLYEVCRVQHLSAQDLKIFDDVFIDYLFDLVEQTRYMQDDTFNYSVIKLIIALNEQFMVAGLGGEESQTSSERKNEGNKAPPEPKNRIIRVMMRRLGSCRTFGENMIFMLNRAKRSNDDFCVKLLILKILYVIFSTTEMSEYFYTNDLCVLMDVFLRELADIDEENESLRHTYLRVLHPLLTKTQLRDIPYKRPQILMTLESLLGNSKIREVNPTTKRLVDRCLSGDWCVQLRELRESAGYGTQRVGSPNSESSTILSPPGSMGLTAASMHPDVASGNKSMKSLKHSKSVEHLSVRAEASARQPLWSPLDQVQARRPSNASIQSLPAFVSPTSPKAIAAPASKRRSTSATLVDDVQTRHNSLPYTAGHFHQHPSPLAPHTRPTPLAPSPAVEVEEPSTQTQPRRRPPPPAPIKRRKPPAIPLGRTHGGATITTIRSSEPSPLSKVYKAPIGL